MDGRGVISQVELDARDDTVDRHKVNNDTLPEVKEHDKYNEIESVETTSTDSWKSLQESLSITTATVITALALGVQAIPATKTSAASWGHIATLSVLGTIFYSSVFRLMILSFFKTHRGRRQIQKFNLRKHDVYDICVKSVSALQALLACAFSWLAHQEGCCQPLHNFTAYSRWIEFYTWFGLPYFLYDIVVMYKMNCMEHTNMDVLTFILRNKTIFFHHMYVPSVGLLGAQALRAKFGDCVIMFLFTMEFSTIFVNLRLILHRLRMTSSPWYFLNAIIMLLSFLLCRIFLIPYLFYCYSKMTNQTMLEAVMDIPMVTNVSIGVFLTLQVYWMALMVRVAVRLVRQEVRRLGT